MASKAKVLRFAYLRTSSAANVGADKDSDCRQRETFAAFASRAVMSWSRTSTTRP
jgi:hypothetical protein